MIKNIILLIAALTIVAAAILGLHYLGLQVDNQNKYKHPITQPGGHW